MKERIYFFSDVHFQGLGSAGDRAFLACLASLKTSATSIIFVGDLLDFWIGHARDHEPYQSLMNVLETLVLHGVHIHYFTGNHDPAPMHTLEQIGVRIHTEGKCMVLRGRRVWVEHGDLVDPGHPLSRLVCRLARMPMLLRIGRALPSRLVWAAAHRYTSRPHLYDRPLHPELRQDWFVSKIESGCEDVIVGHYHRAANHHLKIETRTHRLIALGDWLSQMTYARLDERLDLLRYRPNDMGSVVVPPGDHCPPIQR